MIGLRRFAPSGSPPSSVAAGLFADGLAGAWHFGLSRKELLQGVGGTVSGGAIVAQAKDLGVALQCQGTGQRFDANIPTALQVGMPMSFVVRMNPGDASNTANRFGIFRGGGGYAFGLSSGLASQYRIEWSSGASAGSYDTTVSETNQIPGGILTVRYWSAGRDLWLGSTRKDSTTGSWSDPTYSGTPSIIMGSGANAAINIEYLLVYRRLFTPSEMQTLVEHPYAWMYVPVWNLAVTASTPPVSTGFSPFLAAHP
jgi:hypothetical protein